MTLADLLHRIYRGQTSFHPMGGPTAAHAKEAFKATISLVDEAKLKGYVSRVVKHWEPWSASDACEFFIVLGGLTPEGERYLQTHHGLAATQELLLTTRASSPRFPFQSFSSE